MNLKIATSIDEYLLIVKEIRNKINNEVWFRGQSNAEYCLLPSLFREKSIIGLDYSGEVTNFNYRKSDAIMKDDFSALEKFIVEYERLLKPVQNLNKVDYFYLMQHYGIPTRLLDFTTDELIALYFSLFKSRKSSFDMQDEIKDFVESGSIIPGEYNTEGYSTNGSSIYVVDPYHTNLNSTNNEVIYDLSKNNFEDLKRIDLPVCVKTGFQEPRLLAQKSVFMFFGFLYNSYERYYPFEENITKIFIPNSVRNQMFEDLKHIFGVSHSTVFPDMKGISLEIIDEIEKKYVDDCKKVFKK